jgi:ppGpp synthetase/RelA/SpoT-type nucleotidyltranferase
MNPLVRAVPDAVKFCNEAADLLRERFDGGRVVGMPGECVVVARVKSLEAIAEKMRRREISEADAISQIGDFIGLRVLVLHVGYLASTLKAVETWAADILLKGISTEDRFTNPSLGGYRAVHLGFALPARNRWKLPEGARVEVQVTTWLQHFHGIISHTMFYKPKDQPSADVSSYLQQLSERLGEIDDNLAKWTVAKDEKSYPPTSGHVRSRKP